MDAPFEGATIRSRSQNQDATQTLRAGSEPHEAQGGDRVPNSVGWGTAGDKSDSDDGLDLTDLPSDEEDPSVREP